MSLAGKTIFMSGGSRGIGLAIALRAARDGANIAVAAKTAEPHAKLEGTIYTAAEQIDKAGGRGRGAGGRRRPRGGGQIRRHRHPDQQCERDPHDRMDFPQFSHLKL